MDSQVLTAVAAVVSGGTQPALPGFLNSLAGPLEQYGLWAIFLLVMLEDFGIPLPGETVLIAGAIFAGSGRLNVVAVGVVGFAAAVIGDNIGYAIGRFGGRALVERWGKYVLITPERLDKTEEFFNRHGGKIITIARFIEVLRQANGLVAGISAMRWVRFLAFNALGAALWVGTWVSIGYFAGEHITTIYHYITTYSLYAAIVAVVVIGGWLALHLRKRRRTRKPPATGKTPTDAETAAAGEATTPPEPAAAGKASTDAETAAAGTARRHAETPAAQAAAAAEEAATAREPSTTGEAATASEATTAGDGLPTKRSGRP